MLINFSLIKRFCQEKSNFHVISIIQRNHWSENYYKQIKVNVLVQRKMVEKKSDVSRGSLELVGKIFMKRKLNHQLNQRFDRPVIHRISIRMLNMIRKSSHKPVSWTCNCSMISKNHIELTFSLSKFCSSIFIFRYHELLWNSMICFSCSFQQKKDAFELYKKRFSSSSVIDESSCYIEE